MQFGHSQLAYLAHHGQSGAWGASGPHGPDWAPKRLWKVRTNIFFILGFAGKLCFCLIFIVVWWFLLVFIKNHGFWVLFYFFSIVFLYFLMILIGKWSKNIHFQDSNTVSNENQYFQLKMNVRRGSGSELYFPPGAVETPPGAVDPPPGGLQNAAWGHWFRATQTNAF